MKNDLTCEVVQDLLPSYVDHLTSDVTNTAIETHIRECADCRRILSDMQSPEPVPAETATDASTIDFLKKSNKRNKRRKFTLLKPGVPFQFFLIGFAANRTCRKNNNC